MSTPPPVILNVDDYPASRYVRTQTLTRAGFVVREAATGSEALAMAEAEPPSAVLLDVNLPDISGFEVCRRLKHHPTTADVPILHVSATFTKDSFKVFALDAGADAYLTEPVEGSLLVATLNVLLRARRAEVERDELLVRERAARAEAEAANRAKDDFLAVVSHELRAPLNAVLGWTRLLKTSPLAPDAVERALDTIERNVRHQSQIINDLLDVSRVVSGTLSLDFHAVDVAAVINAAVDGIRPAAQDKGVALVLDLAPVPGVVLGDARRLQQVVGNLLSNAVKFTPAQGRVRVALAAEGAQLRITVSDTGAGIAPDFLPHVFDRFRQAETHPARTQGGLGLGLAIVRHLVELHGGTIEAESAGLGRGATFSMRLPLRPVELPDAEAPAAEPAATHTLLRGIRVLLVEDETDTREVLAMAMEALGAAVTSVASVRDAVSALEGDPMPDAIVSDIGLPGEDGYALVELARRVTAARGARIPMIALTAYAQRREIDATLAAGYDVHVAKPTDVEALARTIAAVVRRDGHAPQRAE